jgi:pantothenate kinase
LKESLISGLFVGSHQLTIQGAPFTFNLPVYMTFLQHLRLSLVPNPPLAIPFTTFDHATKDPLPSPTPIKPQHRIVIIEGLYTMLDLDGWRDCAQMMDRRVWVDVDPEVARGRLASRNFEAGISASYEESMIRG